MVLDLERVYISIITNALIQSANALFTSVLSQLPLYHKQTCYYDFKKINKVSTVNKSSLAFKSQPQMDILFGWKLL